MINRRRHNVTEWIVLGILTLAILVCVHLGGCEAQGQTLPPTYPPGGFFYSRYTDERLNTTPGHWNHAGVVASDGVSVVEAIAGRGVVKTPIANYQTPEYRAVVVPLPPTLGPRVALAAESLIGRPYAPYASVLRRGRPWNPAGNCVSVQHAAYEMATGRPWRWGWTPDGTLATFYRQGFYW